jgi:hypothetical protein
MNRDEEILAGLPLEPPGSDLERRMERLFAEAAERSPDYRVVRLSHALAACALCAVLGVVAAMAIRQPAPPAPLRYVYLEPQGPRGADPYDWSQLPIPKIWDAPASGVETRLVNAVQTGDTPGPDGSPG